jgi:salicylate hydroxylase
MPSRTVNPPLERVVVVGAGIGGLTAALAARRQGFDVRVVEQARTLTEIGAGLQMSANAMWVLDDLGLADEVRSVGVAARSIRFHRLDDGRSIFRTELGERAARRYRHPFVQVHRADLLDILVRALPAETLTLGAKVTGVRGGTSGGTSGSTSGSTSGGTDAAVVVLSDGTEIEADVVIGADGIHSRVREHVLGPTKPEFSGVLGWRALLTRSQVEDLGIDHSCDCWLGPGRSVVTYWLRRGELFNIVGFVPAEEVHRESWTDFGDASDLRRSFAGACDVVENLLGRVDTAFLTGVYFHRPADRWARGRFVLSGDAAHATAPYLAQGACQAIEDAAVLARLLRRHDRDLPRALEEYQQRRLPRTTKVQSVARGSERWWHESDPVRIAARDGMFRGITRLDPLTESVWAWLYDHNPIAALELPAGDTSGLSTARTGLRMKRPEAQRAADSWRDAFTPEEHAGGWAGLRSGYERYLATLHDPAAVCGVTAEGPGLLVGGPLLDGRPVALHVHGGGFMFGSARGSLGLATRISGSIGGPVLSVDYRLAPEHPFPAALDDVLDAYRWLIDQGIAASRIVVTGESAGAALALSAVARLLRDGGPAPAGVWALSPMTDLTLSSPSIDDRAAGDPALGRDLLTTMCGAYAQGHDPADPCISPLFADLTGFPPVLLHAADNEALRDDAVRFAEALTGAGQEADLHLVEDSVHVWAIFDYLPETGEALEDLRRSVRAWTGGLRAD